jgi:hypothetical protein
MSKPLRIALVAEGKTDIVVLKAAIGEMVGNREFVATQVCPESSDSFGRSTGGGWAAVYLWCRQMVKQAGDQARDHPFFGDHDLLVLHVDADLAGNQYSSDVRVRDAPNDLPCVQPCPPASATTDALRRVILGWLNERSVPRLTVLCTPSMSSDTWVLAALFPADVANSAIDLECRQDVAAVLQRMPLNQRLIRGGGKQIRAYQAREGEMRIAWPDVRDKCSEAERFSLEFLAALPSA